jgi:hypothetical protein
LKHLPVASKVDRRVIFESFTFDRILLNMSAFPNHSGTILREECTMDILHSTYDKQLEGIQNRFGGMQHERLLSFRQMASA